MLGFLPTRAYRPGTPGATTFLSPLSGTFNYGWDSFVLSEALLSVHAKETQTALSIARAGLRSFIGKQIGVHDTLVTYPIEGGDAVVTARLVSEINDFETLYLLGSEGVYTDPTFTGSPARRTVYQYAIKREVALDHVAMMTQVTGDLAVWPTAHVDGNEEAGAGCEQASVDVIGAMMGSGTLTILGSTPIEGSPISTSLGSRLRLSTQSASTGTEQRT